MEACRQALKDDGLFGLLRVLNEQTPYRFTGIYRFEGRWVKSIWLYDRENPAVLHGSDVLWDDSYCRMTVTGGDECEIVDSLRDRRLTTHAARHSVQCYLAVLLRTSDGREWGTLCHYDVCPRAMSPDVLELLRAVRPLVERRLQADELTAAAERILT